jgi:hypothetical protein
MDIKFTELFSHIQFEEQNHSYTDTQTGRKLDNVSRLVNSLKNPFDADYWAAKKAPEMGLTAEQLKAKWDDKRKASQDLGTSVHNHIQNILTGRPIPADDPFIQRNKFQYIPHIHQFDRFWLDLKPDVDVLAVEIVLGDAGLNLAGTADCLLFSYETGLPHLFDWKTNERFELDNRFRKHLSAPFQDLDECEYTVYSLQTSLYRLMIERAAGIVLGDSYLVHITAGGCQIHRALDLRQRAEQWLHERAFS